MKQHKFLKITISLILLIALITAASIFLSYNVLTVRTFSYETDKAVNPVRAVVISDLHEHEFGKDNVKLVEKIREQEPDIILMVGDFVNQDSTESTVVVKLVEQLSKLASVWDVDLVVSGHDHGGQVVVPFAGGVFGGDQGYFPKYVHGMYEKERLHLFVSSGLGSANEPLPRVNNLPEVAVVEIEKSTQT